MSHAVRWTLPKIEQRLKLIQPLVYRRREAIPAFRVRKLVGQEALPLGLEIDDSTWELVEPSRRWGEASTYFLLRSSFTLPVDWPVDQPCALYLPLGEIGDFGHPEAMVYIDGYHYAGRLE